jgi:hypothetical protein
MDGEVVVGRFDAPHEAELARNFLREHGVPARVDNDVMVGMNPLWGSALGGVRLYVAESRAESAAKLLADLQKTEPASEKGDEAAVDDCREADATARRALVAAVIGTFILPIVAHVYSLVLALPLANHRLSPRGRRYQAFAVVVDTAVLGLFLYLLLA